MRRRQCLFECSHAGHLRLKKEDQRMNRTMLLGMALLVLGVSPVYANAPGGGYEGISAMYYGMIALVLVYGAWDIFFKKD